MKILYFCRHGESELNAQEIYAGQLDTPLTDLGREQARKAGEQARDLGIDLIVSSTLSRAKETAEIIAETIGYPVDNIVTNPIFMERSLGVLQGKSWKEFAEPHGHNHVTADEAHDGIESDEALEARAREGLAFLEAQAADTILLVGHGSFGRALTTVITGRRDGDELPNATIAQFI